VRNERAGRGDREIGVGEKNSSDTLLGFEATRFGAGCRLTWWWGVVFECWIVVASI
jgi:hypothetical protein